jgi:Xaa-Pro aminopeptidase
MASTRLSLHILNKLCLLNNLNIRIMKYAPLDRELFRLNRKRFTREMKPNTVAIFNANDLMPRSGDAYFAFRQNAGLYYLCGIDQEETMLVLYPDCKREGFKELLLIKRTNEHIAVWEGHKYTKEEARQASGIEKVLFLDEAEVALNELILLADAVYLNLNENDRFISEVETRDLRYARWFRQRYPAHEVLRAQPMLKKLQMVKSRYEVEAIQRCVDVTGDAFRRVLNFIRPGVMEYEIEAEIIHEFTRRAMTGHAYSPIIASGKNACTLHYTDNNRRCNEGEVVLMDFGCEYANYNSDLTRSVPVSGFFTERQRAVYDAVLRILKEARALLVPGNLLEEYHKEVGKFVESELLGLGLISRTDIDAQDKEKPAYKKYFMHGVSHHLGLDVHDVCLRYEPFRAGMVLTCEPGIYIPEENLGIRLENNILITDDGPIDLFKHIPIEAEEIEEMMNAMIPGGAF